MSFLKNSAARVVTWSLTIALVAQGPILSAEQRVSTNPDQLTTQAGATRERESVVQDVQLHAKGVLTTRVVDLQGNLVVGAHISVMYQGKEIATAVSDDEGVAAISGLRSGLHAIITPTSTTACRFWDAESAPPSATSVPAVVSDEQIIRGQLGAFNVPMFVVLAASVGGLVVGVDAQNQAKDAKDQNKALEARIKALEPASP